MLLLKLNPIEPPWYGPVCPVVWEGRRREVSPYPDHLLDPPASRRLAILEHLGAKIFRGWTVIRHRSSYLPVR